MSGGSIGTIAGGAVGGLLGFFAGAPGIGFSIGATLGGTIGNALDPPKGPKIEGQRLNDLTVQTSTYGAFIPRLYGTLTLWGNIFWIENNKVKEVSKKLKSGGKGIGGSKASAKTYSYYGTFAVGLCEGPIIGIKKIWIGPKLFYNADGNNPDTDELVQSAENSQYFKVYKGDDTQLPDPRMQATLGAANTPAYRGHAYIIFYDLPLAEYGNSIALTQIKVEVIKSGALDYIFNHVSNTSTDLYPRDLAIYKNFAIVCTFNSRTLQVFDISDPSNPLLACTRDTAAGEKPAAMFVSGSNLYVAYYGGGDVAVWSLARPEALTLSSTLATGGLNQAIVGNDEYMFVLASGTLKIYSLSTSAILNSFTINTSFNSQFPIAVNADGTYLYVITDGIPKTLDIYDISNISTAVLVFSITLSAVGGSVHEHDGYLFVTVSNDTLLIYDISDPTAPSLISTTATSNSPSDFGFIDDYIFIATRQGLEVFDISDLTSPAYVSILNFTTNNSGHAVEVIGNYIYVTNYGSTTGSIDIFFFIAPVILNGTVLLSDIVSAESLQSNLITSADIDVTSLTPLVRGYRISQVGAIRGGLDQLQAAWPFDAIQSGYKIKYILRGGVSVATIDEDYLDAREIGQGPGVQISNSREMDAILPAKVSIKFFDVNREYDTGDQYAERINTDAVNIREIELSIALTAPEAAQKAEILLYMYWMERYEISFKLPPEYSQLEPSDIITITSTDATYIVRLKSISYTADGRIECKGRYHVAATYVSHAVGEEGQSTGVDVVIPGNTIYRLLDIPMLQDVYDKSGYSVAMTGYQSSWPGGVIFVSDDDGQIWTELQAFTPPGSTIGYAKDTLSTHGGTVLDYSSRLTIRLYQGTLSSVTETQMFTGSNWFAYGADGRWEIIAAMNVILQSDDDYLLFDFLRGQMGTEWATGLHSTGDTIVLLNSDDLVFLSTSSGYIGVDRDYRGITVGDDINSDNSLTFSYDGVNLEPLSPCQLTGSRHPTNNDWTIVWTRRSRYAGWRNLADIPLGETTESYEIEVYSSGTYTTLKRTLTSTTQTVQYTSAQQVTDFGSNQSTIYLKIYQLSSVVGRGYALTQSLTRT